MDKMYSLEIGLMYELDPAMRKRISFPTQGQVLVSRYDRSGTVDLGRDQDGNPVIFLNAASITRGVHGIFSMGKEGLGYVNIHENGTRLVRGSVELWLGLASEQIDHLLEGDHLRFRGPNENDLYQITVHEHISADVIYDTDQMQEFRLREPVATGAHDITPFLKPEKK